MYIETTLILPETPNQNTSFYERATPDCVLSSPTDAEVATVPYGNYSDLTWTSESVPAVLDEATTWGTKTFPGAGPFYFANHEDGTPTIGLIPPPNNENNDPGYVIVIDDGSGSTIGG